MRFCLWPRLLSLVFYEKKNTIALLLSSNLLLIASFSLISNDDKKFMLHELRLWDEATKMREFLQSRSILVCRILREFQFILMACNKKFPSLTHSTHEFSWIFHVHWSTRKLFTLIALDYETNCWGCLLKVNIMSRFVCALIHICERKRFQRMSWHVLFDHLGFFPRDFIFLF